MRIMFNYCRCLLLGYFLICIFFSCRQKSDYLVEALSLSGTNRKELENVLNHYKDKPEKLKAAQFLIKNMIGKYTLDTMSVSSNQPFFDKFETYRKEKGKFSEEDFRKMCNHLIDSLSLLKKSSPYFIADLSFLSADKLISHIDNAFELRVKYPWSKNVSFDDFCKYVLPYKVESYYWDEANIFYESKYQLLVDSFSTLSLTDIGRFIQKETIDPFFLRWLIFTHEYPFLLPATLENIAKTQVGRCLDFNVCMITALRSIGIPVALNTIPCYGNSDHDHFWMEVIDEKEVRYIYDNETMVYSETSNELVDGMFHVRYIIPPSDHLPEYITIQHNRKMAKIYRLNYEIIQENIDFLSENKDIPNFFKKLELEDITNKYIKCKDIEIKLWEKENLKDRIAYLCCYDSGKWTPVCRGEVKNNEALFKNMGVNVLYLPAFFQNGKIIPANYPFILSRNGDIKFLSMPFSEENEKVILYSKVPLDTHIVKSMSKMIGAKFQLANSSDLSDTITVHNVEKFPYYEYSIDIDTISQYRYVICNFSGLKEFCMAEWNIYTQTITGEELLLKGQLAGNKGLTGFSAEKVMDDDRVSYFQNNLKNEEQHLVFDLGKPTRITKIKYNPRSDDNRIVNGEIYELYYWDQSWISLGKQVGVNNCLIYSEIPKNVLLRIHNHTRGKEHRPFTFEENKQVWW